MATINDYLSTSSKSYPNSFSFKRYGIFLFCLLDFMILDGMYPVEIDEPKIGDVAQYLTKVQVVKPIEDYHLVLPSQLLNFNQGEIISNEAFVSFTKSTKTFWIQPNPEEVDVIMSRIELHTTDPALPDERISDKFLTKGTTCLALYPDDAQWYRAVIESNGEDNIFVNYIDYGNSGNLRKN